ncbi:MAG: TRAP transporter large permease subunit [Actinobacteria bacterium]|nr:TRAP transporter large permease subunit [Actinomycetota bacterium]
MVKAAGYDLVWFGIYLVMVSELGQITPPVGFNLFMIHNVTKQPIQYIIKSALPFIMLLLLATLIIVIFPEIPVWLPGKMITK